MKRAEDLFPDAVGKLRELCAFGPDDGDACATKVGATVFGSSVKCFGCLFCLVYLVGRWGLSALVVRLVVDWLTGWLIDRSVVPSNS